MSQSDTAATAGGDNSTKCVDCSDDSRTLAKRDFQLLNVEQPIPRAAQNDLIDRPLRDCSDNNDCHRATVRRLLRVGLF